MDPLVIGKPKGLLNNTLQRPCEQTPPCSGSSKAVMLLLGPIPGLRDPEPSCALAFPRSLLCTWVCSSGGARARSQCHPEALMVHICSPRVADAAAGWRRHR